jgi:hypothetical protein
VIAAKATRRKHCPPYLAMRQAESRHLLRRHLLQPTNNPTYPTPGRPKSAPDARNYFGSTFRLPPGEPGGGITGIPAPPAGGCNTPPCCRPLGAIRSGGICGESGDERRGGVSFGGAGCGFCAPAAQGNAAAIPNRKKASLCVTIGLSFASFAASPWRECLSVERPARSVAPCAGWRPGYCPEAPIAQPVVAPPQSRRSASPSW